MQARQAAVDYGTAIRARAKFNALQAALEIYLAVAEKGQLPETLPDTAPKDPFSGNDFEYEKTPTGFTLRSRIKPVERPEPWEFAFKVHDPNGTGA